MNPAVIERLGTKDKLRKTRLFGIALAVLTVLYISAIIAFIIVY
ncbi:MAG: hypothetical protein ACREQ7_18320 [Candidatus Binatia bacterium]